MSQDSAVVVYFLPSHSLFVGPYTLHLTPFGTILDAPAAGVTQGEEGRKASGYRCLSRFLSRDIVCTTCFPPAWTRARVVVGQNTSAEGVYALGDVTGRVELTPMAIAAGRRLSDRLFAGMKDAKVSGPALERAPLWLVGRRRCCCRLFPVGCRSCFTLNRLLSGDVVTGHCFSQLFSNQIRQWMVYAFIRKTLLLSLSALRVTVSCILLVFVNPSPQSLMFFFTG